MFCFFKQRWWLLTTMFCKHNRPYAMMCLPMRRDLLDTSVLSSHFVPDPSFGSPMCDDTLFHLLPETLYIEGGRAGAYQNGGCCFFLYFSPPPPPLFPPCRDSERRRCRIFRYEVYPAIRAPNSPCMILVTQETLHLSWNGHRWNVFILPDFDGHGCFVNTNVLTSKKQHILLFKGCTFT